MPTTTPSSRAAERDSARVRLEALFSAGELTAEDVDFVVFHFMASDPGLYQPAALAAGRHLVRNGRLREALAAYAASRGLALDVPVTLNGRRAARRLLLALAVAVGAAAERPAPEGRVILPCPPFALKEGPDGAALLPTAPVDLSVWLYALEVLARSPAADAAAPGVRLALEAVPEHPAFPVYRRVSWRWGDLLAHTPEEERFALWKRGFSVVENRLREISGGGKFARGLQTLFFADGVIRAGVAAGCADAVAAVVREAGVTSGFLGSRLRVHIRRAGTVLPGEYTVPASSDPLFARAFRLWGRPESLDSERPGIDPVHAEAADLVGAVLSLLGDESSWTALEAGARAFALFLAMDLLEALPLELEQARAMLRRVGLAPKDVPDESGTGPGGAALLLQGIVVRCLSLEPTVPEGIFEEGLLHAVDDSALLLSLVPGNRPTPLAGGLADAFEHRLRLGLRQQAGADPEAVLGRLLVRDAHADVFGALAEVSRDRQYPKSSGGEFPLYELSRHLQDSAQHGTACKAAEGVLRRIWALRGRVVACGGSGEGAPAPAEWVARLRDSYGFSGDGGAARNDSIFGVVRALNYRDAPMLQGGKPAWSPLTATEWIAAAETHLERLDTLAARMDPGCWQREEETRQAAGDYAEVLNELESSTILLLPAPLRAPLEGLFAQARSQVAAWARAATGLAALWEPVGNAGERWSPPFAERALKYVTDTFPPEVGTEVLLTVLTALCERARAGCAETAEDAFFAWAAAVPDKRGWLDTATDPWLDRAAELWCGRLRSALEARDAERVTEYLRDARFGTLRTRAVAADVLSECGKWAMDALRPGAARAARKHAETARGLRPSGRLAFAGTFLLHFSPVWIGLLIGAVLMFDFGDAWKAMAEEEQLGGIIATFVLGITGTFLYLANQQRLTVRRPASVRALRFWGVETGRCLVFLGGCLVFTFLATTFLWFLLSGTDEVVKGAWAVGHIVVWSGFSLVFGVFLGLVAKGGA